MRLGLSSAAAPEASLDELLAACLRRGLVALELREEDGHGVSGAPDGIAGAEAQRRARTSGVEITGFRSRTGGEDLALARVAAGAGAPVLVAGSCCLPSRVERGAGLASVGAVSRRGGRGGALGDALGGRGGGGSGRGIVRGLGRGLCLRQPAEPGSHSDG